ncbi:glycogen debranching protein, partial [Streptomyces sp. MCAF7]
TRIEATPGLLSWTGEGGRIDLAYESPDTIRLRGEGLGLRIRAAEQTLTPFTGAYFFRDPVDGAYVFTSYETGRRYRITALSAGAVGAFGAEDLGSAERGLAIAAENGGVWEAAVEELDSARRPYTAQKAFDQVVTAAQSAFAQYADAVAPWRSADTPAAELAAYVLWSATVNPAGFVTRPGVLMSKHWMD